jgi:DNA-binding MarR family transcriptional regulator
VPSPDLNNYLAYLLASANRTMSIGLVKAIAKEKMTEQHWRILQVLSDENGRVMGELAEQVLMNHPALTKNIDKLVSSGLVMRKTSMEDSRKVLVFISDKGLAAVQRLTPQVDAHHQSIDKLLGHRKTAQLKKLLDDFVRDSAMHN